MGWLVTVRSEVKLQASRSESESEQGDQLRAVDAKPGDLSLDRVKRG